MSQAASSMKIKGLDEKFCSECGQIINIKAEICPKCGVRQSINSVNKTALLLLAFFLGGIGGHKFYLGKYLQGIFYILFCWTGIPAVISLIEFIMYAITSDEDLQAKYTAKGGVGIILVVLAAGFGMISLIGIIAAIAIPNFIAYRNRAVQIVAEKELRTLSAAEESYFSQNGRYSSDLQELNFMVKDPGITVEIIEADSNCYQAVGKHTKLKEPVTIDCNTYREMQ